MTGKQNGKKSIWLEMQDDLKKVKVSNNPKTNFIIGLVWFLLSSLFILYMFIHN